MLNFMTQKPKYKYHNGIKTMEINGDFNAKQQKPLHCSQI